LKDGEWPARISEMTTRAPSPVARKKADLLGQPGLHIVGAVIFALIEAVRRQVAHAVEAGRDIVAAGMEEGVEQVGPGLVHRDEDVALLRPKIVVEIERPILAPVAEHHVVVEGRDLAQGAGQGRRETRSIQLPDRLSQGGMPIQRPLKHLSPQSGAKAPPYPSGGIYTDGRLPQPDAQ
jgi:hypothetical protein